MTGLIKTIYYLFADGFSTFPSILTYFSNLDDTNLPPHWDIGASLSENSPTVLLHVNSGIFQVVLL